MAERHAEAPFDLLVLGGDQIYADSLWHLPEMEEWVARRRRARHAAPFTEAIRAALEAHYLKIYATSFGDPDTAAMLAAIPSAMIWDDHDIVDGWGSRPAGFQASPVARGLFEAARRAFCLVQLGRDPDRAPATIGWDGRAGCAHLVAPDLRSERTRARVMGPEGHRRLAEALARAEGAAHLLVVSSVPLINADLSAMERAVAPVQPLVDLYQDDLRDQWMSYRHRREWAGVTGTLLGVAAGGARVTVLSGEIHLGAHGVARRDGAEVTQLIASGIAHPAPPQGLARLYEGFARVTRSRAGAALEMRPVTPDGRRFLAERNWLEVEARPDGGLDAVLHGEVSGALPLG
jgi:phosphodiesterase/alkaline phosphatase D-like protein